MQMPWQPLCTPGTAGRNTTLLTSHVALWSPVVTWLYHLSYWGRQVGHAGLSNRLLMNVSGDAGISSKFEWYKYTLSQQHWLHGKYASYYMILPMAYAPELKHLFRCRKPMHCTCCMIETCNELISHIHVYLSMMSNLLSRSYNRNTTHYNLYTQ